MSSQILERRRPRLPLMDSDASAPASISTMGTDCRIARRHCRASAQFAQVFDQIGDRLVLVRRAGPATLDIRRRPGRAGSPERPSHRRRSTVAAGGECRRRRTESTHASRKPTRRCRRAVGREPLSICRAANIMRTPQPGTARWRCEPSRARSGRGFVRGNYRRWPRSKPGMRQNSSAAAATLCTKSGCRPANMQIHDQHGSETERHEAADPRQDAYQNRERTHAPWLIYTCYATSVYSSLVICKGPQFTGERVR